MNGRREFLPILQDFVPYQGRCPKRLQAWAPCLKGPRWALWLGLLTLWAKSAIVQGPALRGGGLTYFSAYLNIRISHSMNYFPFFLACSPHPPALHHLPLISLPPPPSFWPFSSSPSFLPPPTHSPTQLLQIGNFLCSE